MAKLALFPLMHVMISSDYHGKKFYHPIATKQRPWEHHHHSQLHSGFSFITQRGLSAVWIISIYYVLYIWSYFSETTAEDSVCLQLHRNWAREPNWNFLRSRRTCPNNRSQSDIQLYQGRGCCTLLPPPPPPPPAAANLSWLWWNLHFFWGWADPFGWGGRGIFGRAQIGTGNHLGQIWRVFTTLQCLFVKI